MARSSSARSCSKRQPVEHRHVVAALAPRALLRVGRGGRQPRREPVPGRRGELGDARRGGRRHCVVRHWVTRYPGHGRAPAVTPSSAAAAASRSHRPGAGRAQLVRPEDHLAEAGFRVAGDVGGRRHADVGGEGHGASRRGLRRVQPCHQVRRPRPATGYPRRTSRPPAVPPGAGRARCSRRGRAGSWPAAPSVQPARSHTRCRGARTHRPPTPSAGCPGPPRTGRPGRRTAPRAPRTPRAASPGRPRTAAGRPRAPATSASPGRPRGDAAAGSTKMPVASWSRRVRPAAAARATSGSVSRVSGPTIRAASSCSGSLVGCTAR